MAYRLKDGKLVCDSNGHPIDCATYPAKLPASIAPTAPPSAATLTLPSPHDEGIANPQNMPQIATCYFQGQFNIAGLTVSITCVDGCFDIAAKGWTLAGTYIQYELSGVCGSAAPGRHL